MTITLAAGAARTVANANGFYVQFLTTVPAGGVIIDVEARTATALTGGADLSRYLKWGKKHLMQLDEGANTLSTDAGSFTISYQPAYL
jgi:phage-related protein